MYAFCWLIIWFHFENSALEIIFVAFGEFCFCVLHLAEFVPAFVSFQKLNYSYLEWFSPCHIEFNILKVVIKLNFKIVFVSLNKEHFADQLEIFCICELYIRMWSIRIVFGIAHQIVCVAHRFGSSEFVIGVRIV